MKKMIFYGIIGDNILYMQWVKWKIIFTDEKICLKMSGFFILILKYTLENCANIWYISTEFYTGGICKTLQGIFPSWIK